MVTPVSGSPTAFELFHTRRLTSPLTLPVPPRERTRLQDRVDISATGRQQETTHAAGPAEEQTAAQRREAGLPSGAPQELETTTRRALESLRQRDQEV
jgi:hypothetical protein